jgi:hypothetical protein
MNLYYHRVKLAAHERWVKAGKPEGRDEEFWKMAEADVLNETIKEGIFE